MTIQRRSPRAPRSRRLLLATGVLVVTAGVGAVVVLDPGGHTFAAGAPTVLADPTAKSSAKNSAESSTERSAASSATSSARSSATSTASASPSPTASASPTRMQILGLGDSVTAATNCNCTDFITALGRQLASQDDIQVASVNRGVAGATAADLDDDLGSDDDLRHTVADSDVIIVTIGANDLAGDLDSFESDGCDEDCYQPDIDEMSKHLNSAITQIRQIRGSAPTTILLTTYWNVFTDGEVAAQNEKSSYPAWSDAITRQANAAICGVATTQQATCVDLYTPFKDSDGSRDPTDLLADDGDHPNAAGEKLIGDALFAVLTRADGQAVPQ